MARLCKIPEVLHEEVLAHSANGESANTIKLWLKNKHNVVVGISSVQKLLNRIKSERQAVAQATYAEAVASSANLDIKIINEMVVSLQQEFRKAAAEGDRQGMKHMSDALHKFLQTRMDLSGINKPVQDSDNTLQSLLDRIGDIDDDSSVN